MNLYEYALDNPVSNTDPTGKLTQQQWTEVGMGAVTVGLAALTIAQPEFAPLLIVDLGEDAEAEGPEIGSITQAGLEKAMSWNPWTETTTGTLDNTAWASSIDKAGSVKEALSASAEAQDLRDALIASMQVYRATH